MQQRQLQLAIRGEEGRARQRRSIGEMNRRLTLKQRDRPLMESPEKEKNNETDQRIQN